MVVSQIGHWRISGHRLPPWPAGASVLRLEGLSLALRRLLLLLFFKRTARHDSVQVLAEALLVLRESVLPDLEILWLLLSRRENRLPGRPDWVHLLVEH